MNNINNQATVVLPNGVQVAYRNCHIKEGYTIVSDSPESFIEYIFCKEDTIEDGALWMISGQKDLTYNIEYVLQFFCWPVFIHDRTKLYKSYKTSQLYLCAVSFDEEDYYHSGQEYCAKIGPF